MELTEDLKTLFIETARTLKGFERRRFQAQTIRALGPGGPRLAERELGWNRCTLRKAAHELESGLQCLDAISTRRRQRAEEHLPTGWTISRRLSMARGKPTPSFAPIGSTPGSLPPKFGAN